jgi:hypothetical protein
VELIDDRRGLVSVATAVVKNAPLTKVLLKGMFYIGIRLSLTSRNIFIRQWIVEVEAAEDSSFSFGQMVGSPWL